jgi:hypothetical protein
MVMRHETLLVRYVKELRTAKHMAEAWWEALLIEEQRNAVSEREARRRMMQRWPSGPASHPFVIHVIQRYHQECEALNRAWAKESADGPGGADRSQREEEPPFVYPHVFLVEWLLEDETEDLVDFLGDLAYWPIGLDEQNNVV